MPAPMTRFSGRFRRLLVWLVPAAVLVLIIGVETDWARELHHAPAPETAVAPPALTASVLPEYSVSAAPAAVPEMVTRTLFNPTRRPAPVLAAEAAKPQMQRGQFALSGTLMIDGKSTALLRELAGGKPRRAVQGETINGMVLAVVKPDRVTLKLGDETEELVLKVATNSRPTPQPAAPAPGGSATNTAAAAVPGAAGQPPTSEAGVANLAERRRAAQQAQNAGGMGVAPPPANSAQQPPVAPQAAAAATPPDPRWEEVYQRYRERAAPQK